MFSRVLSFTRTQRAAVLGAVGVVSTTSWTYLHNPVTAESEKTRIVVIGGGTAGITVSSQLLKKDKDIDITVVDGSKYHYYQPAWTLVGAGLYDYEDTRREMRRVVEDAGADLLPENVNKIRPDENKIVTTSGREVQYDYLVVAAGMTTDWTALPGLKENIGKNGVVSNYDGGEATHQAIQALDTGSPQQILFTFPATPVKCGGAPQKVMYLAQEYWQDKGSDMNKLNISFYTPAKALFPVAKYAERLAEICEERHIHTMFTHTLTGIEVKGDEKHAIFRAEDGKMKRVPFDLLHVVPPMGPPPFLNLSPIANAGGWVDVDKSTLQSTKYSNIFALGDCSSVPTSKTAAAICAQAPVLVKNLLSQRRGEPLAAHYNGYTSCPLMTGKNSLLLMEFGYGGEVMETFPWDQRWDNGLRGRVHACLKTTVFPWAYWNLMLKGRWYGPSGIFEP